MKLNTNKDLYAHRSVHIGFPLLRGLKAMDRERTHAAGLKEENPCGMNQ
jgi:hypothetical protein